MTYGSLFSGIGGIDLGLDRAGMRCIFQCETDPYACKVLEKHWPGVKRYGDITQVNWEEAERPDLLCGGFPCQDLSFAGKGAGLAGKRSWLFYEVIRAACVLRPRYLLLENVAALLVRGMDAVLGSLASIRYDAEWHCIPAAYLGASHIRDRVFIFAYTDSNRLQERIDEYGTDTETSTTKQARREAIGVASQKISANSECEKRSLGWEIRRTRGFNKSISWNKRWQITNQPILDGRNHGIPNRLDRLRCLGNAVVPQVAEMLGKAIMEYESNHNPQREAS